MRVLLETRPDDTFDVTEDVKRVLDALHSSLDWGSGFLDEEQTQSAEMLMKALEFRCFKDYSPSGGRYVPCRRPYGHEGEHGQEES